jgi:chromosomal replication initiation ATPase DnaA
MHLSPLVRVIHACAINHNCTAADLQGPCRKRPLVEYRQEAYYFCWVDPSHPALKAIGRRFGGRDHTTIRSGIKKYCDRVGLPHPDFLRGCRSLAEPEAPITARILEDA